MEVAMSAIRQGLLERLESAGNDFDAGRIEADEIRTMLAELKQRGVRPRVLERVQFILQALAATLAVSGQRGLSAEVEVALGDLHISDGTCVGIGDEGTC